MLAVLLARHKSTPDKRETSSPKADLADGQHLFPALCGCHLDLRRTFLAVLWAKVCSKAPQSTVVGMARVVSSHRRLTGSRAHARVVCFPTGGVQLLHGFPRESKARQDS